MGRLNTDTMDSGIDLCNHVSSYVAFFVSPYILNAAIDTTFSHARALGYARFSGPKKRCPF